MKTPKLIVPIILSAVLIATGCTHRAHESGTGRATKSSKENIAMQNNAFAFDLMRHIPFDDNNLVISPFSISTALAMTYVGASGETRDEMAKIMRFDPDQQRFHPAYGAYMAALKELAADNVDLNIANSLWAHENYHFLETFFETVNRYYHSEVFQVDFMQDREQIRQDINQWVYDETREKIEDLIAPNVLTPDTRLVLVNAIHFWGSWLKEFDKDRTRPDNFRLRGRQTVRADFMHRVDTLPYFADDMMQVLEIPYAGGDFSMLLVLPAEGIDIEETERKMDAEFYAGLIGQLSDKALHIYIPRFEAETKLNLEDLLVEMGMVKPFSRDADFSGMTGDRELNIDQVIHQAVIEVNEEGTEAAAATAVVIVRTAVPEQPTVFRANRPFLFFVKDNVNQSILFNGRVMRPGS